MIQVRHNRPAQPRDPSLVPVKIYVQLLDNSGSPIRKKLEVDFKSQLF